MAKTVLVVEDSPDDVVFFMDIMKKAGLPNPVAVVRDGAEAIAYLKGQDAFADRTKYPVPEVMFLDLRMPRVNGFEVLEWLQEQPHLKNILLVAVSHSNEIKDVNRAYNLGAHSFLVKPVQRLDLINLVSHFGKYWSDAPPPESPPSPPPIQSSGAQPQA